MGQTVLGTEKAEMSIARGLHGELGGGGGGILEGSLGTGVPLSPSNPEHVDKIGIIFLVSSFPIGCKG